MNGGTKFPGECENHGSLISLDFDCHFGGIVLIGVVRIQRHLVTQMQQCFAESNG